MLNKKIIPWNKDKKDVQVAWNKGKKFPEFSGENNPTWKPKIKKECLQCKKKFEVVLSLNRVKFCSQKCYWISLKGCASPMKDKKHSIETLEKIRASKTLFEKGHKTWNKNKKYIAILGKKHWNYKGGTSPLYEAIRGSFEYENWRKATFERDDYTCKECFKRGGKELHSHHKKPFALIFKEFLQQYSQFSPIEDKEILIRLTTSYQPFWDIDNGETLCIECHKKTDNYLVKGRYL